MTVGIADFAYLAVVKLPRLHKYFQVAAGSLRTFRRVTLDAHGRPDQH